MTGVDGIYNKYLKQMVIFYYPEFTLISCYFDLRNDIVNSLKNRIGVGYNLLHHFPNKTWIWFNKLHPT